MPIKTIIVDDEPEARTGLNNLLSQERDIEVIAICKNGLTAIQQIEQLRPDLVFLDVQMPKVNGFEVLNSIAYQIPYTVFVTAYDQYALKAFEVNAQDYLLKPFSNERFTTVLERVRKNLVDSQMDQSKSIKRMIERYLSQENLAQEGEIVNSSERTTSWNKLTIKNSGKISFVNYAEIQWIEGYDYCIKVHTNDKEHVVRASLKQMEAKLSSHQFVRVSKSAIVNMNSVKEILPHFNNSSILVLDNSVKVKVSRSYRASLDSYL